MRRSWALVSVAGVIAATPVTTWWLVGDISEPGGYSPIIDLPSFSRNIELRLGLAAATVLITSVIAMAVALRQGRLARADRRASVPLVLAGIFVAVGARILSSATVGANIGGGMVMMAAPFVLLPLLTTGLLRWYRIVTSDHL